MHSQSWKEIEGEVLDLTLACFEEIRSYCFPLELCLDLFEALIASVKGINMLLVLSCNIWCCLSNILEALYTWQVI